MLSLVIDHFQRSHKKESWFDKFAGVFSSEAAYEDLATSMTRDLTTSMAEDFKKCISHTPSSSTDNPSADHLVPPVKSRDERPFTHQKTFRRR